MILFKKAVFRMIMVLLAGLAVWQVRGIGFFGLGKVPEFEVFVVGDRLPSIQLETIRAGSTRTEFVELHDVIPDVGCAVLVYVESSCPACQSLAGLWSGVGSISGERRTGSVKWVGINASDDSLGVFASRYEVGGDVYRLRRDQDRLELGIRYWPQIHIVGHGGEYLGPTRLTGIEPADIELPPECSM